jgi:hypothetical protein
MESVERRVRIRPVLQVHTVILITEFYPESKYLHAKQGIRQHHHEQEEREGTDILDGLSYGS